MRAGLEVREERIPRELLYVADEIFVTGTAAEITPVKSVDRKPIGDTAPGPRTLELQRDFYDIVHGKAQDRFGWLTHVSPTVPNA